MIVIVQFILFTVCKNKYNVNIDYFFNIFPVNELLIGRQIDSFIEFYVPSV